MRGMFVAVLIVFLSAVSCADERNALEKWGGYVSVVKYDNGAWDLQVGGRPYVIKGVTFGPVKIGEDPGLATMRTWMYYDDNGDGVNDIAYQTWLDENKNDRKDPGEKICGDFRLLKEMGCNTIRLYHIPSDNPILGEIYKNNPGTAMQFDHPVNKELLRQLYKDYGIRVIMGNFLGSWTIGSGASWEEGTDYTNPVHRENMKKSVKAMILDNKDEPYVLMWLLGNENNIATFSKCNAQNRPEAYAKLVGEIASMIHELDGKHPVAVSEGDDYGWGSNAFLMLKYYAKYAPEVDIVAYNSYRGKDGFGDIWTRVKAEFDRPVYISECGIFAYNTKTGGIDEDLQLEHNSGYWKNIVQNSADWYGKTKKGAGNSIGVTFFDWVDRWYLDGNPFIHDVGTGHWVSSPDNLHHEEYFGIVSMGDGSDWLMRQKRKIYDYFREVWKSRDLKF